MSKEKQIYNPCDDCQYSYSKNNQESGMCKICEFPYFIDRKQSEVIDEFAERLKEAPIKCELPLFGLSTKAEIEEYFNDIMLQVRDAIDNIAQEMKGV